LTDDVSGDFICYRGVNPRKQGYNPGFNIVEFSNIKVAIAVTSQ
jgi:hypothetical protein